MIYSTVDLHCHSTASDGVFSPKELAHRANDHGVKLWSLTDHDEVAGQAEAMTTAQSLGIQYVTGVEISVTWAGRTLHMVGLNYDMHNAALCEGLQRIRDDRTSRAYLMAEKLEKLGCKNAYEGALSFVDNPELISRTHFARYMVEQGFCTEVQEAFDKYLADGKPAYVAGKWATLEDAVEWILGAGGVAVIAHPGRYKYTATEFTQLFNRFKALGGTAIEVVTGSHRPEQYAQYAQVAQEYGFLASCGSDFHGFEKVRLELGRLPLLPEGLTPVWKAWYSGD